MDDPQPGGPIAYAGEVAPVLGFQSGLLYYHQGWIGNLAIAITGVDYLSTFFPILTRPAPAGVSAIALIWLFAGINMFGPKWISRLVSVSVIGLLIPVVLTGTIGWFYFKSSLFMQNWNVAQDPNLHAIMSATVLCIWSFIGVESASVNAGLVKNPKRTVPLATLIGTGIAGLVYFSSSTVICGLFPSAKVAASGAPFALATGHMFGQWTLPIVSAVTAFACLACLGSWMMMVAQAGLRASQDGTLPPVFSEVNHKNISVKGILINALLMSPLMIVLMLISKGGSTQELFGRIISITVLLAIIPYFYSALQLIRLNRINQRKAPLQLLLSGAAIAFCFLAFSGAEHKTLVTAILVILGVLIYYVRKDRSNSEQQTTPPQTEKEKPHENH